MLVPDIDHAASLLGEARGPVHVRVTQQREAGVHAFLREGPVLEQDVTLAGPLTADLWVSTTGTDADWIVKLIDEQPGKTACSIILLSRKIMMVLHP